MMRNYYASEYRINKKGRECFRSRYYNEVIERYRELVAKNPKIYTIQRRDCNLVGPRHIMDIDWRGRINWSPWADATPSNNP